MTSTCPKLRNLLALTSVFLLLALPGVIATPNNETEVAITAFRVHNEGGTLSWHRSPSYHDLVVNPPATVTFRNVASFYDEREDGQMHMVEIYITSNDREELRFAATYHPPYEWHGTLHIDQEITAAGGNPEEYKVFSHYLVYKWENSDWQKERDCSMGEFATVYKEDSIPLP